jgi:1A family penicillin-binding protein
LHWKRGGSSRRGGRRSGGRKILSWVLLIGLMAFFAGAIVLVGLLAWVAKDLPDPNNINDRNIAQTTTIYDRTGKNILYEIHGDQKRTIVDLSDISPYAIDATITAEDRNFYSNDGIDIKGILRAVYNDVFHHQSGTNFQGGSTITQQFIKNSVLSDQQTMTRKIQELLLSLEMEQRFTKDQILKLYLNEIPYGSVSYGIQSASQTFFGKNAKDLTLSEAALLASLPRGPTYYSPYGTNRDKLIERQQYIIDSMVQLGYATKQEGDAAKKDDVLARIKPKSESIVAPHFVFYVKQLLADEYGDAAVEQGGLKVITTLDVDKQKDAEQSVADGAGILKKWDADSAAMAAIDPHTGDILAMVGSTDYNNDAINGKFNNLLGRLQPGSSIKPIVYAAAFEKGYTPSTVLQDVKTEFSTTSQSYSPSDYDGKERGPVTATQALAGSLNIPSVEMLYLTGFDKFENFAERLGYTTFHDRSSYGLSLVLGGAEVNPLEHIDAYTAFAQEGTWHPSRAILKVTDKDGKVLEDHTSEDTGKKAFDPEISREITDILSNNAARAFIFGDKNFMTLPDRPVAAKTGTTNNDKDAWTIGYTPSLVAGVWVGNSAGHYMKPGADGSIVAAPIWNEFMKKALAGTPVENFTPAQPVVTGKPILDGDKSAQAIVKIDRASGKLATALTPPDYVIEQGYGVPHSILYFVNKDDPRGPVPDDPGSDPEFANWEKGVADWAATQHFDTSSAPPTEFDDVHIPENIPTVSITSPAESGVISQRTFIPAVTASARRGVVRVDYAMDGEVIGTSGELSGVSISIPNDVVKGFHTLTATAYDDVGNSATASVTVNLTADVGPLALQWLSPYPSQSVDTGSFPFTISASLGDRQSIAQMNVVARPENGGDDIPIGSMSNPALPNLSFTWATAPAPGRYAIVAECTLNSGETQESTINIVIR